MERKPVYYSEYLQLDKILNAQETESSKEGIRADDEMLFITIHQAYELWFKQLLYEVDLVREVFKKNTINDNKPYLQNAVHRLRRCGTILQLLVQQIDIMETMTPLDFLDFRDLLRPASGFQSIQFKQLEALLGLQYTERHGQEYYISQLNQGDISRVKKTEEEVSLLVLINQWLERLPIFDDQEFWADNTVAGNSSEHAFWQRFRETYKQSLSPGEKLNLEMFDQMFMNDEAYPADRRLSPKANRSALFIMLYRDYPLLYQPFQLLNALLEIDDLLAQWRYRHMNMVQRVIGRRVGTGGSTGAQYLKGAADKHYIFREVAELTSFLIQRSKLPVLEDKLTDALGFKPRG